MSPSYSTTNTNAEDRRKAVRYLICGTVGFQWLTANEEWEDAVGITRDIGKGGVLIESDSIPPVGSLLKLTVTLPSESKPNLTLQLGGTGWVRHIRQEPSQPSGFGASAVFHVEVPMCKGMAQESQ